MFKGSIFLSFEILSNIPQKSKILIELLHSLNLVEIYEI